MKIIIHNLKKELTRENIIAAISCLIISITFYFIMGVLNREVLL